jgi:phosphonate transport system permease protein
MSAAADWPTPAERRSARSGWGGWIVTAILFAAVAWAWNGVGFDLSRLAESPPRIAAFLARMVPPDLSVACTVARASIETLQIAFLGTVLSAVLSIGLGMLAAANLTPRWVHEPVKWMLGAIRGVPLILLAMLMVGAVGLGPFPGVLTVAIHSTGMLGKFYAEAFESVRPRPLEALDGTGATWAQTLRFAALPQITPDLVRDTLFRFELNLRDSLVLGLVGAGGIGFYIQTYVRTFQYPKVATLTLVVLAMVIIIEQASVMLRRRLR